MPFLPQSPARRLTHTGKEIETLQAGETVREIAQEIVEAAVFLSLAETMGGNNVSEASAVDILTGIVLMNFCADRLVVVCKLLVRLTEA